MKFRFLSVACMIPKALAPGCSSHTMSYHIPFDSLFSHETSNWKKWKLKSLSHVQLFAIPWTVAYQALPSMGFSRQEYWSGLTFPSPGDLPDPRIKPRSPTFQADTLTSEPPGKLEHQLCLPLTHLAFTFTIPSVTVVLYQVIPLPWLVPVWLWGVTWNVMSLQRFSLVIMLKLPSTSSSSYFSALSYLFSLEHFLMCLL